MHVLIGCLLAACGLLFGLKLLYLCCTAVALPRTGGALYVSSPKARIEACWDVVAMQPGQTFIDLGCGDGRVLRSASRRFGVQAVGFELNLLAYCKARLLCLGDAGIRICRRDFRSADLSQADVVFCYLFPDVLPALARHLSRNLKPGAVVISCNFPVPGWPPLTVLRPPGALCRDPVFIYQPVPPPGTERCRSH